MKKFFLLPAVLLVAFFAQAQNYEEAKNMMLLMQYKKAKEAVDKGMANAKYVSKPEAFILKAAIYAGLANEAGTKGTAQAEQLITEADAAFNKYREMDPSLALVSDPVYQNGPINIYSALFSSGYKDYERKNWQPAFEKFKRVVEYSDLLISKKIIAIAVDTNSLLLAGINAESSNNIDDAAKYYTRLADLKIPGKDFEGIYRFLVRHYFTKKDMASFEKYKAIGKQLYPGSEYFNYDIIDFAVGLEDDFNKRILALEEAIIANPNNDKAQELLGELIYDTLNSNKEGAVQPANAAELEKKMIIALNKSAALKPGIETPYLLLGGHFINNSIKINDERDKLSAQIKARTKPGTQLSKDDIAKRDALDQKYFNALEAAREPYEKAVAVFAKKENMSRISKQQYKNIVSSLADIYSNKKIRAKGNAADQAKFAAEEKKWNDLYDTIK